jgi:hypothetical protein
MCNFALWVNHNGVHQIHELIELEFMNEYVGFLLVSIEEEGFPPLERFIIESPCWNS